MYLMKKEPKSSKATPTLSAFLILLLSFIVACGSSATSTPPPQATTGPTATVGPTSTSGPGLTATTVPLAQAQPTATPPTIATHTPSGELKVAMQTFGNERWLPGATAGAESTSMHAIFENLLTRNPETGENVGELAESWESRDGGIFWEFKLREGVQFHDGWGELTADDVQFSFERVGAEGSASARANIFSKIVGYEIVDPLTIVVEFSSPEILLSGDINSGIPGTQYIYSKKAVTEMGEEKADLEPIATGPYKLISHSRGDRMRFEAVEGNWKLTPAFAEMTFIKVVEDSTRVAQLRAGSVDIIDIGVDFASELKAANVNIKTVPGFATVGITLGGQWPGKDTYDPTVPWALPDEERAKKVRMALALAIDKETVVDVALGGLGSANVALPFYFQGEPWTIEEFEPIGYDPERARELLAEAGYEGCWEFTMNLVPWPGRAFLPVVGEAVATQWEANLGCKINRRPLDRAVFATDFRERTYPGVAVPYAMPFVGREPWQILRLNSHGQGRAMLNYEDPQIDDFLDQLGATADFAERVELLQEMGRVLYDKLGRIEIAEVFGIFAIGDRIKRWDTAPGNGFIHNTDYVNLVWAPPGQRVVIAK